MMSLNNKTPQFFLPVPAGKDTARLDPWLTMNQKEKAIHKMRSEESHGRSYHMTTRTDAWLATCHLNLHGFPSWR